MTHVSVRSPGMSVVLPNHNHGYLITEAAAIARQTMLPLNVVSGDFRAVFYSR
jgi:hypothetical protein